MWDVVAAGVVGVTLFGPSLLPRVGRTLGRALGNTVVVMRRARATASLLVDHGGEFTQLASDFREGLLEIADIKNEARNARLGILKPAVLPKQATPPAVPGDVIETGLEGVRVSADKDVMEMQRKMLQEMVMQTQKRVRAPQQQQQPPPPPINPSDLASMA
jgi:hypothetical protein